MKIKRGSTSVRRLIFIGDSSSTTGSGLASLVYNSAGLVAYYFAGDLSNEVSISLATATLGTWTSGGFIAVDNNNMPGWYEIGIPDAALDAGNEVAIQLRGAADMVPVNIYIELDAVDYQAVAFGASTPTNVDDAESAIIAAIGEVGVSQNLTVERTASDTNAITFGWPVSGATITAEKSINNGAYAAVSGAIAFLRTESSKHYYTLAHNAADRPSVEGQVRYKFVDGTYTRYVVVRVAPAEGDATASNQMTILSAIDNVPTVAEFETRTIVAANYATAANLTTVAGYLDTEIPALTVAVAAVKVKTDQLSFSLANQLDVSVHSVVESGFIDIFETYQITESYPAVGVEPTPAQAIYTIQQVFGEFTINGTTISVKKLDGTEAATYELDSATRPLSRERVT